MYINPNTPDVINQADGRKGFLPNPIRMDEPNQLIEWRDGTREYFSNDRLSSFDGQTLMVDATA